MDRELRDVNSYRNDIIDGWRYGDGGNVGGVDWDCYCIMIFMISTKNLSN